MKGEWRRVNAATFTSQKEAAATQGAEHRWKHWPYSPRWYQLPTVKQQKVLQTHFSFLIICKKPLHNYSYCLHKVWLQVTCRHCCFDRNLVASQTSLKASYPREKHSTAKQLHAHSHLTRGAGRSANHTHLIDSVTAEYLLYIQINSARGTARCHWTLSNACRGPRHIRFRFWDRTESPRVMDLETIQATFLLQLWSRSGHHCLQALLHPYPHANFR